MKKIERDYAFDSKEDDVVSFDQVSAQIKQIKEDLKLLDTKAEELE